MTMELYYWPGLPGRGEYVRLVLEAVDAPWRDMARLPERQGGGMAGLTAILGDPTEPFTPFACPVLKVGDLLIAQTPLICAYLGETFDLAPDAEPERLFARQIALTTADLAAEAHDVHHPLGAWAYYDDQKPEAQRRAAGFRSQRIPKFLGWYERVLTRNRHGADWLVGARMSYADLGLFQTVAGLRYAFPRRMAALDGQFPAVAAVVGRVAASPRIAAYLASDRRLAFNEDGLFRHYPELDDAS
ncbi:glutathione S-transferase [Tistrella bauzanensis]|uniref:Glutathione S-transferase n=1 Tax=Tistrella bauzanensis TaxID=657419 RepID=A0ABQ1IK72_9PROT|nr:glutathione S-transferase [Tistrella bauzanensis]GGB39957.1 glutathione S-transferase [Tistrella bauzanensis]